MAALTLVTLTLVGCAKGTEQGTPQTINTATLTEQVNAQSDYSATLVVAGIKHQFQRR